MLHLCLKYVKPEVLAVQDSSKLEIQYKVKAILTTFALYDISNLYSTMNSHILLKRTYANIPYLQQKIKKQQNMSFIANVRT